MALRLLAFKQIHKILGIECLNQQQHISNNYQIGKKRQLEVGENESNKFFIIAYGLGRYKISKSHKLF